jgi:hypothetical protein
LNIKFTAKLYYFPINSVLNCMIFGIITKTSGIKGKKKRDGFPLKIILII